MPSRINNPELPGTIDPKIEKGAWNNESRNVVLRIFLADPVDQLPVMIIMINYLLTGVGYEYI